MSSSVEKAAEAMPEDDNTAEVLVGRRTGRHWYPCVYNRRYWHLTKGRCGARGEPFGESTWTEVWRTEGGFDIETTR